MLNQNWLKDIFAFTKKDRIFAIFVVFVIAASLLLPKFFAPIPQPLVLHQDSTLLLAIDTLQQRQAQKPSYRRAEYSRAHQYEPSSNKRFAIGELFEFDPNTASFQDWQRLGLNERTSKTIQNYVNKGGRFYKPQDLQKIWGMPEGFYDRVKDYVVITSVQKPAYTRYDNSKPKTEREERKPVVVNINEADTAAFIALPGIGSKLSARIVAFREKLGGFYSVEQVGETYGLPDSTFQLIKGRLQIGAEEVRKLNVNTVTKEELKVHPYIRWNLANAIVEY
ncbi:MAG TPA: helix-hairpin-helix domain-containing protein, partial [Flavisolibacter sp.]|nr:helix-hairpin-helix domain-containing protein [Flavisolibacter sp.]